MNSLTKKQNCFNKAMEKYHKYNYYQHTYKIVSILNVSMQIFLLFKLFSITLSWYMYIVGIFIIYFITDFINGLVHMYMDNNDNYSSIWGPFIASFHLHHKTQKYKDANLFMIYFNESGAKFWLVFYLLALTYISTFDINPFVLFILISFGILSSVAEVSHYLCHNSNSKFIHILQDFRLLLPMSHHINHHTYDNQGYAFLNPNYAIEIEI